MQAYKNYIRLSNVYYVIKRSNADKELLVTDWNYEIFALSGWFPKEEQPCA
jgi:hypothetical protein